MKTWSMRHRTTDLAEADFELRDIRLAAPLDGQILVRTVFISLDPYLARAMKSWDGEVPGWSDGSVHGRLIGEVLQSRSPNFAKGDRVLAVGRWQEENVIDAAGAELIPPDIDPPSLVLGVLGRSGITAWVGLYQADAQPGETILISAASGPVGSVVGQLAKSRGCMVVGTAGGAEKCRYVTKTLGFDVCVDNRDANLDDKLATALPKGAHILFENVGGPSLDPALSHMAYGGRIMLCGLAAHYLSEDPLVLRNFKLLLYKQLTLRAFVTANFPDLFGQALTDLRQGVQANTIQYFETIVEGLENAPAAFIAMLEGQGLGKRLVKL